MTAVDTVIEDFIRAGLYLRNWSPQTADTYRRTLRAIPTKLTKDSLERWVIGLRERGLNPGGCNVHIRSMNSLLSWLREDNENVPKPLKLLKVTLRVKTLLTAGDIKLLVTYRPHNRVEKRTQALMLTLLDTGVRIDEGVPIVRWHAKRRRFDVLVCWRLDRLGRNLRHLVGLLEDLRALGVEFVSLGEGIDCTTPAGKLQLHILAALAEFERERIRERVLAGLQRARAQGRRLGRPAQAIPHQRLASVRGLSVRQAARRLGVSPATAHRWLSRNPLAMESPTSANFSGISKGF